MLRRLVRFLGRPNPRFSLGVLLATGVTLGAIGAPTFGYVVHETSTDAFCLKCHDRDIGLELAGTPHFDGALGVQAGCADCHLPKAFWPKVFHKAKVGAKDVYHHFVLGTLDTHEKFEAHRMHMAMVTWAAMNANDSRECRSCHDDAKWDVTRQSEKAQDYHGPSLTQGKTCIDCHKGIAHRLPQGILEDHQIEGIDD